MAFAVVFFVLSACALSAVAETGTSGQCSQGNLWDFLQVGVQVDMLKRSFTPRGGANTVCLTSTTKEIDAKNFEVSQKIEFGPELSRKSLYQKYWVLSNTTMRTTSDTGLPHARYELLKAGTNCAVVNVTYIDDSAGDITKLEGDSPSNCVLWVKDSDKRNPDQCCSEYYTQNCQSKQGQEVYKVDECKNTLK
uniref:Lipocalin n=1 Tax=Rhipicephalus sanguineus TaxID=34632 RepID=C9W1F0_RHISA